MSNIYMKGVRVNAGAESKGVWVYADWSHRAIWEELTA